MDGRPDDGAGSPERTRRRIRPSFARLVFVSDAVVAIVITLLVLPLTAEIDLPEGGKGLVARVLTRWPTVLTLVVSCLVVGRFGIGHHRRPVRSGGTTTP